MSYILDALKKSEQERPPGPVPDLFTVHGPQPAPPRKPVRAIVAVLLFLVVLAISLWAWIGTGGREEGAARPPVAASLPARVEAPAAPQAPRVAVVPAPAPLRPAVGLRTPPDGKALPSGAAVVRKNVPASKIAAQPAQAPVKPARKSPPVVAASPAPAQVSPVEPAPPLAVPATSPLPATPPMSGTSPVPAPVKETPVIVQPTVALPAVAQVAAPEQDPPVDGRVLNLNDLPAPVRAELPKLLVSGHVWSDEPGLRLLSVDDRLLHEGDEAAPGVSLQEITQAGAIFVYKGWHFRVAGRQP